MLYRELWRLQVSKQLFAKTVASAFGRFLFESGGFIFPHFFGLIKPLIFNFPMIELSTPAHSRGDRPLSFLNSFRQSVNGVNRLLIVQAFK